MVNHVNLLKPHQGVTYMPHVILINLSDTVQILQMTLKAHAAGLCKMWQTDSGLQLFFFPTIRMA